MNKPTVTSTNHLLPFGELSPAQFERLCLWLVEREGYLRPEHLGEAGSEQGRDVIAFRATDTGEQLWYFQCKRYQTISAATLIKEVEKYNKLVTTDPTLKPFGVVFVTNATLSADARKEVSEFCTKHGYESLFWARTELDMLVKKHPAIVTEFFNLTSAAVKEIHLESSGNRSVIIRGDATGATIITGDSNTIGAKSSTSPVPRDRISISRLPVTGSDLFGRDNELQRLDDAWANPDTNIIAFVAWGGVGKTALVNHWLKQRMVRENYRGADRVYAWSFYSQGTSERAASADLFIDQALRWFGDADPTAGSPWDKGERLANYIRQSRTLLILDGLEPLQHPPGPQEGRLKDAELQTLLVELAAQQPGLCVVSTRERIGDLVEFENSSVEQVDLGQLSAKAGAQLLRSLKVKGDDDEFEQAVVEYEGHALALTLLGSYLSDVYAGDIRRRHEIENLEEDVRHGRHAERVMRAYEKWLGESVELAVLRLLGLFDRPADFNSISELRSAPAIPELTEPFQNLKGTQYQQALSKLRRIKLLSEAPANDPNLLDAHPLVRDHFRQRLKVERPDAWCEANNRLYEYLTRTAKEFPDTVEEMSPLFAAVTHGCAAGRHQEVFDIVFQRRIQRGDPPYTIKKLGALGANLAMLSNFYETPWEKLVEGLTDKAKSFLPNAVGLCLRGLGQLQESLQPIQAGLEMAIAMENWKNAAIAAGNLSEPYLALGYLNKAIKLAQQSLELADRSNDEYDRIVNLTILADALYKSGSIEDALAIFRRAEDMQKRQHPQNHFLYSVQGFQYCDLLLGQGQIEEVKGRATVTLQWVTRANLLLDIALDKLSLGRACLLEAQQTNSRDASQAAEFLQNSVKELRQAGQIDFLPLGLLARAELHRLTSDYSRAERDLAEVHRIASRSGMGLHLADYHLESARLNLAQGNQDKAREHWTTASEMIERMGYHRRDKEVNEIAAQLR
jgi:tetratricopeptide (TPR) repeat protein